MSDSRKLSFEFLRGAPIGSVRDYADDEDSQYVDCVKIPMARWEEILALAQQPSNLTYDDLLAIRHCVRGEETAEQHERAVNAIDAALAQQAQPEEDRGVCYVPNCDNERRANEFLCDSHSKAQPVPSVSQALTEQLNRVGEQHFYENIVVSKDEAAIILAALHTPVAQTQLPSEKDIANAIWDYGSPFRYPDCQKIAAKVIAALRAHTPVAVNPHDGLSCAEVEQGFADWRNRALKAEGAVAVKQPALTRDEIENIVYPLVKNAGTRFFDEQTLSYNISVDVAAALSVNPEPAQARNGERGPNWQHAAPVNPEPAKCSKCHDEDSSLCADPACPHDVDGPALGGEKGETL